MSSARSAARLIAAGAVSGIAVTLAASAASAHVDPDPVAIEAGKPATVSFTIEHGCDGSPTIELQLKIPDGFTAVSAPDKDGWTATVSTGEVVWKGGPLDAATQDSFSVELTAPAAGDYAMPAVQTCEQGSLAWVQEAVEGQPEPDLPAPVLKVTEGAPTDEDLAGGHDDAATDDTGAHDDAGDHAEEDASGGTVADHHAEDAASGSEPLVISPAPTKDDDSNTGLVVGIVVAAVVVLGGGGYALSRRGKRPTA